MPQIIVTFDLPFKPKNEDYHSEEWQEYIENCRDFIYEACLGHGMQVQTQELIDWQEDKNNGW